MEASSRSNTGTGWFTFAGVLFVIAGVANILWGIGALDSKEYLPEGGLLFSSLTFWGWVSIIWGALQLGGSYLLLTRSASAPGTGVVLATVSAIFWLFALPVFPIWSMVIIGVDILIIYGLVANADAAR